MTMRYSLRAALFAALAFAAACDSPSKPHTLEIRVDGALARDSVVHVKVVYDGDPVPSASEVTLTASPADAVQLLGGDSLRFLKAGNVAVSAKYRSSQASRTVTVAGPPPLGIEATGKTERGMVIHLRVTRGGATVPAGEVTFAFTPADGAQALGGDSIKLLRAGTVQVRATAGRDEGTRDIAVTAPPSVIFDRVVDSNRDLWRVDLDGGGLTRLTDDPAEDIDPTVAGSVIVFVSLRAGVNQELYSMPVAGGAATRLTRTASNETMPSLSPNGQRLAYINDVSGVAKLWLASADGTNAARASTLGGDFAIDAFPSWAPGSTRLAFSSSAAGSPDIYSFPFPGAPAVLVGGNSTDVDPAYSPDGSFVAFASNRGGGTSTNLYLANASTGAVTRLTTSAQSQGQPTWTADGRLVFTEFDNNGRGQLRWIDPSAPAIVHNIDTGTGSARNPAGVP